MPTKDDIGIRGEAIFELRITDPHGPGGDPLFRPYHLGEKFPTLDYLVELVGLPAGRVGYFFAQVKSTRKGFTRRPPSRLPVKVSRGDIDRMLTYPGPTYIIGIDERPGHERAYIASVNRPRMGPIQGLPPTFALDAANMNALWKEVEAYWSDRNMVMDQSIFDI
jgi:hypothetical protein